MKYLIIVIVVILLAGLVWLVFFSGKIIHKKVAMQENQSAASTTEQANQANSASGNSMVVLETTFGQIKIQLNYDAAPKTAANFEKLVRQSFYNGLTFHRVVPGFVIQGGDPRGDGTGGPGYTLPAEIKLPHKRGSVAMARLPDQINPNRDSSGSQFYIALQDLSQLDGQYTVFGQVVAGMDVVDKIAAVKTDTNDKPLQPVIINRAYLAQQ